MSVSGASEDKAPIATVDDYGWGDKAPHSAGYLNRPVRDIVSPGGPYDILDAGCGNGALSAELAGDGHNVVGVDADRAGIEAARRRAASATFFQLRFDSDPALLGVTVDGKFDVVVSTEVIEHLYAPHELVEFTFAALRPGGRLVVTTPYHGFVKNLALSLTNRWDDHFSVDWPGGHIKFWSRKTLSRLLVAKGFLLIEFHGVGRVPYLWKSMVIVAERPRP